MKSEHRPEQQKRRNSSDTTRARIDFSKARGRCHEPETRSSRSSAARSRQGALLLESKTKVSRARECHQLWDSQVFRNA